MANNITSLNNYLQDKGQLPTLTWGESYTGPCHRQTWTVHCKINGEIKGTGTGTSKPVAKQIAAEKALAALKAAEAAT